MNDVTEQLDLADLPNAEPQPKDVTEQLVLADLPAVHPSESSAAPGTDETGESSPQEESDHPKLAGYRLIESIGEGGYGVVWKAEAPGGMLKAVKIVHGRFDERRAIEELKSLERIKDARHPFLLSLERIEVVDGKLIVVTELADESLKQRHERCVGDNLPGIPRDEVLRMLGEAADALDYMSARHGLAHLDIKPENILLVGDHVKVADFGLVKNVHGGTQSIVGGLTPLFAAPETFDGRPSDRSDQYSLAVVYQFVLTGKLPFNGTTTAQLAAQHTSARPDLSSLPEPDRRIVERALAKDPFDRFENCRGFVDRLQAIRGTILLPEVSGGAPVADSFQTDVLDGSEEDEGFSSTTGAIPGRPTDCEIVDLPPVQLGSEPSVRPTLLIGLGGCGAKTLRALSDRLDASLGPDADPKWLNALLIDTNYDEFVRNFVEVEPQAITEKQFVHIPLRPTQYYRKHAGELTRWLSRRWIYNIPKTQETDGIRPLGRLAMVDHIQQLDSHIDQAVASFFDANLADDQCDSSRPRIMLVGSLTGGTGGAIFADVAQIVHRALARFDNIEPEIICLLAHWTSASAEDAELSAVNACAALKELNHYQSDGCPGDVTCHLPALGRHHGLFKHVYYVDLGWHSQQSSFVSAADTLAMYLQVNLTSKAAEFGTLCREHVSERRHRKANIRTFDVAALDVADLEAAKRTGEVLTASVLREWLLPEDEAEFADQVGHSADQVIEESGLAAEKIQTLIGQLNEQRIAGFMKKAAEVDPGKLEKELKAWLSSIDEQFPSQPAFTKTDGAKDAAMQTAVGKFAKQRASAMQRSILEVCADAVAPALFVERLMQQLFTQLQAASEEAQNTWQEVALAEDDAANALERLTAFAQFALRRNTCGWVRQFLEYLKSSIQHVHERATKFSAAANSALQNMDLDREHEADLISLSDQCLVADFSEQGQQLVQAKYGSVSSMMLRHSVDPKEFAAELAIAGEQLVIRSLLKSLGQTIQPTALKNGGARRVMIAAPQELLDGELLSELCEQLAEPPTLIAHDLSEILLWCEGEQINVDNIVASLVGHRPELRDLASRLHVRNDVPWANF